MEIILFFVYCSSSEVEPIRIVTGVSRVSGKSVAIEMKSYATTGGNCSRLRFVVRNNRVEV